MSTDHHTCGECWRPVVGFEKWYDVSCRGRVRTKHTIGRPCRKRLLSQTANAKGYLRVRLTDGKQATTSVVHRLILAAFVGPCPSSEHEANHKNGIKSDNRLDNLEWLTRKENNRHAVVNGFWHPHVGEAHGMAVLTEHDVRNIRTSQESDTVLARHYGVTAACIYMVRKRRNWKHVT